LEHSCSIRKQPIQKSPQANPTANPPATEFLQLQAEAMKNLILSADTYDTIYRRCIGPHLANSFDFQRVWIGILLLNTKHLQMKSPQAIQQQSHIVLAANTAEFLKLQTEEAMKNLM
jgi:hypothetical protein